MSAPVDKQVRRSGRRGLLNLLPQFGLRSLLLLVAAVATWMSYYTGRQKIAESLHALESLHAMAPELHVRNPDEFACLLIDRDDEVLEYHCYLPPGRTYQLNLVANKDFGPNDNSIKAEFTAAIASGEHRVLLEEKTDRLIVKVDGQSVLDLPRNRPDSSSRSWTGASQTYQQQWHPVDEPLPLIRLSQRASGAKWDAPGPGIILWIEQAKTRPQETKKASDQPK